MKINHNTLIAVFLAVIVLLLLGGLGMGGQYYGSGFAGGLSSIIFFILIVLGIVWLFNHVNGGKINNGKEK